MGKLIDINFFTKKPAWLRAMTERKTKPLIIEFNEKITAMLEVAAEQERRTVVGILRRAIALYVFMQEIKQNRKLEIAFIDANTGEELQRLLIG